ncbi:hypothetical protein [Streptomyces sp. NPDC056524]|uniref:hypothetical protein n=1 Tax=Streptomyces sp. NPDC056524 TaxID=3345851 RepID=UPI0036BB0208
MPEQKKPPAPQAVAYGARLKAIFELSGATRAELSVQLKGVITKQSNAVAMTRIFDGTDVVPRTVADEIIAFSLSRGAKQKDVDALVNGTSSTRPPGGGSEGSQGHGRRDDARGRASGAGQNGVGAGWARHQAGGEEQQGRGAGGGGRWSASLGELRGAAQLAVGSAAKLSDYWRERGEELGGELRESERRVGSLKTQLAAVKGEATASAELRRQLGVLREANCRLEAEAVAARRALQGPPPVTSEQTARELRQKMSGLRRANEQLRVEVDRSNEALRREREQWEARAKAAEEEVEALRGRLEAAVDFARLAGRDLAERDAVIEEQARRRQELEAERDRLRIEADAWRDEVGRLGLRVLDLEERLVSRAVSETETRLTAPLPRRDTTRDILGSQRPPRRFDSPPRVVPPSGAPGLGGYGRLDRAAWDAMWTPSSPPPSSWRHRVRDVFAPNRRLAGSALLLALGTQIVGVTLSTLHVMISRGTLPPFRAAATLVVVCTIVLAVFSANHYWIYKKNRVVGAVALIILTGCAALTYTGNTTTLAPALTKFAQTQGTTWADRGDGKSCDEHDYCTPENGL